MAPKGTVPSVMFYRVHDLELEEARKASIIAADLAFDMAPKVTGASASRIKPIYGPGMFGITWSDDHLWYQEVGINPRTMNELEGKAQPLDELVLTPSGWSKMGDLSVGDQVIGSDGAPHSVTGIFPQGPLATWIVRFSDGTSVRCSGDHLWQVSYRGGAGDYRFRRQVRTTEYLASRASSGKWSVPLIGGPVLFAGRATSPPIDPYLLGVLLSEGCRGTSPTFSQKQIPVVEEVRAVIPEGIELKQSVDGRSWRLVAGGRGVRVNPISRALRELGLSLPVDRSTNLRICPECGIGGTRRGEFTSSRSVLIHRAMAHGVFEERSTRTLYGLYSHEKFIPDVCQTWSVGDRLSLLQGLMDGDGSCPTQGAVLYHTSSLMLARGVAELARGLGCRVTEGGDRGSRSGRREMFRVAITPGIGIVPFRAALDKKLLRFLKQSRRASPSKTITSIERCDDVVEMQCISVNSPDQLYVTSGFTLTHNTIPIWIDDPFGYEFQKNPKARRRTTYDGRHQILIFRKVAKKGQTKTVKTTMADGSTVMRSVPASYPGAPGRISRRIAGGQLGVPEGRVAGQIAMGNTGVRWRHPGLYGKGFMSEAMRRAAHKSNIVVGALQIGDETGSRRHSLRRRVG